MYRVLVVLSFALLAACSPNEVPSEHLVERQGVFYEINSQTPFTGRSVSYHKNGQLESTVNWKDGKKDGLSETYYDNGQLKFEIKFTDGKETGLDESYTNNGLVEITSENFVIRQGVGYETDSETAFTGVVAYFHSDGQLFMRSALKDGIANGLTEGYYQNTLLYRSNYKDGNRDGLTENYRENGQLDSEICYKNGQETDMSYCEK